jgi:hypothetical protein
MGAASMIGNASTERSQPLTGKSFDMVENFLLRQRNVAVRQPFTNDSRCKYLYSMYTLKS